MNFMLNFAGKLTSLLQEKFGPFSETVSEFPQTLWLRQLEIPGFKLVIKRCN